MELPMNLFAVKECRMFRFYRTGFVRRAKSNRNASVMLDISCYDHYPSSSSPSPSYPLAVSYGRAALGDQTIPIALSPRHTPQGGRELFFLFLVVLLVVHFLVRLLLSNKDKKISNAITPRSTNMHTYVAGPLLVAAGSPL
jgi:hypothetical protein